jgi:hypothetical protein
LMVADVRTEVLLSLGVDLENFSVFKPAGRRAELLHTMLNEVLAWGGALKTLRTNTSKAV